MHHEKIYLYEGRKDVTLTAYVLDNSPEIPIAKSRGAVIICPGGAYLGCSDREGEPVAMAFAAMGYHTFVLRYSVYNENIGGFPEISAGMPVKPHCVFPNPMLDIAKAMLFVRSKASEWGIDTNKIAVCGFSAGGHNCAMYSVYWNKPILTQHYGVNAEELRPAASILAYPVTDYVIMNDSVAEYPQSARVSLAATIAYMGTDTPSDELLHKVSPARLVDKDTPPTFLWTTYDDMLVPVTQTLAMANGLAASKIPFEMHVFEKGPHGLSLSTEATAVYSNQVDADSAKWVEMCGKWLNKRFGISLPKPPV